MRTICGKCSITFSSHNAQKKCYKHFTKKKLEKNPKIKYAYKYVSQKEFTNAYINSQLRQILKNDLLNTSTIFYNLL